MKMLAGVLILLLVPFVAWAGPPYVVGDPSNESAPPSPIWTPPTYRDSQAGDSLLRSPDGDSTGRSLLAPPPIYRPVPYPDQRGRPLMRER